MCNDSILYSLRSMCEPNLKCLVSSASKIWHGTLNVELGHVTLTTPTWGTVSHSKTNTSRGQLVYEI